MNFLLIAGWALLGVRLLIYAWITMTKRNFLRRQAGVSNDAQLLEALKGAVSMRGSRSTLNQQHTVTKDTVLQLTVTEKDFKLADKDKDGVVSKVEWDDWEKTRGLRGEQPRTMFDEAEVGKANSQRQKVMEGVMGRVAEGVFFLGKPELFQQALNLTRLGEAFHFAGVLLNGISLACMILGPHAWWLVLMQLVPNLFSFLYLHQLIMREFGFLHAICNPSADVLVEVENETAVVLRNYEELRAKFQVMFLLANPLAVDINKACKDAFHAADKDKGGTLSYLEFSKLVSGLTGRAVSQKLIRKLLRMIDVDQSGVITIEEFVKFTAPVSSADAAAAKMSDNLQRRVDQAQKRATAKNLLAGVPRESLEALGVASANVDTVADEEQKTESSDWRAEETGGDIDPEGTEGRAGGSALSGDGLTA